MNEEEVTTEMERYEHDRAEMARMIFTGLGIGLLAGIAIGILIAPKTGRETRTQIRDMASEWGQKAKDIASTIGDKVTTTKEAIKRGAEVVKDTYKDKKDEA